MAKGDQGSLMPRLVILAVCACAIAYGDSIVEIYLRQLMPMSEWQAHVKDLQTLEKFYIAHQVLWTEQTRQISMLVLIVAISLIAGSSIRQRLGFFLWSFAIWELFHYLSLYSLIKWPGSLATWDVLFLVPRPWVAPVYVPVIISLAMIMCAIFLVKEEGKTTTRASKPRSSSKGKKKESAD